MTEASKMNEVQNGMIHETGEALSKITAEMQALVNSIDHIYSEISGYERRAAKNVRFDSEHFSHFQQSAAAAEEVSASANEQLTALESIAKSAEALSEANQELLNAINKFNV